MMCSRAGPRPAHITHHVYDLAGRLKSVTYASGTGNATTVTYVIDADGRKTSETDSLGHSTNYTYDAAGDLLTVLTCPHSGSEEAGLTSCAIGWQLKHLIGNAVYSSSRRSKDGVSW